MATSACYEGIFEVEKQEGKDVQKEDN